MHSKRNALRAARSATRLLVALPALGLIALWLTMVVGYSWYAITAETLTDAASLIALFVAGTLSLLPATFPVAWWLAATVLAPGAIESCPRPRARAVDALWALAPAVWPLTALYTSASGLFAGTPSMWLVRLRDPAMQPTLIWVSLLVVTYGVMWLSWALPLLMPRRARVASPVHGLYSVGAGAAQSRARTVVRTLAPVYLIAAGALPVWQLISLITFQSRL